MSNQLILIAEDEHEIAEIIGADRLIYQDMDDLVRSVAAGNADLDKFEDSVFSGEYITADISASYLEQLELFRADAAREDRRRKENAVLELHNDG